MSTALTATDAARDAFLDWDREHQQHLVDAAPTTDDATAALEVYRGQRDRVILAFSATYTLIAAAASAAASEPQDLFKTVTAVVESVDELRRSIAALQKGPK